MVGIWDFKFEITDVTCSPKINSVRISRRIQVPEYQGMIHEVHIYQNINTIFGYLDPWGMPMYLHIYTTYIYISLYIYIYM